MKKDKARGPVKAVDNSAGEVKMLEPLNRTADCEGYDMSQWMECLRKKHGDMPELDVYYTLLAEAFLDYYKMRKEVLKNWDKRSNSNRLKRYALLQSLQDHPVAMYRDFLNDHMRYGASD